MYTHTGIRARRKGERYDQPITQEFWYEDEPGSCKVMQSSPPTYGSSVKPEEIHVGTLKVVGSTTRTDPVMGGKHDAQVIELTTLDGRVVPCTRLTGNPNYVIVQNLSYKMFNPNPKG